MSYERATVLTPEKKIRWNIPTKIGCPWIIYYFADESCWSNLQDPTPKLEWNNNIQAEFGIICCSFEHNLFIKSLLILI